MGRFQEPKNVGKNAYNTTSNVLMNLVNKLLGEMVVYCNFMVSYVAAMGI